ncbi:MAG: TIGR04133 family radical SAM/SPASM protein [Treponema sp.]|jgi:radical SAM enzyme (rSAM/lipoprotein system)|nr:TIGR04133 family radical SAM/SPASM protein [Treponema sp.]
MPDRVTQFFFNRFKKNEAKLHDLRYLFWECTARCNLSCLHCGSDCSAGAAQPDMPFADFLAAIRPLQAAYPRNSITVAVTGGEPLLRPDLAACGRALREAGFLWGLVSNGCAYDEACHERLRAAGLGALTISLDGLEESHNWLRNTPRGFARAVRAISLAARERALAFDVVTCVNKRNLPELPALKALLEGLGVRAWRLFTIAPIGRAAEREDLLLDGPQLRALFDFIARERAGAGRGGMAVTFSCEGYTGPYERRVRDNYFFCRAGIHIASILLDGSISACPNIDRGFSEGNIYQDDFLTVWNTRFARMRSRAWMRDGPCADCAAFRDCRGGALHLRKPGVRGPLVCHYQMLGLTRPLRGPSARAYAPAPCAQGCRTAPAGTRR